MRVWGKKVRVWDKKVRVWDKTVRVWDKKVRVWDKKVRVWDKTVLSSLEHFIGCHHMSKKEIEIKLETGLKQI